jgi:hypothetical protein
MVHTLVPHHHHVHRQNRRQKKQPIQRHRQKKQPILQQDWDKIFRVYLGREHPLGG